MTTKKKTISFYVSEDWYWRLKRIVIDQRTTMSKFIIQSVESALDLVDKSPSQSSFPQWTSAKQHEEHDPYWISMNQHNNKE